MFRQSWSGLVLLARLEAKRAVVEECGSGWSVCLVHRLRICMISPSSSRLHKSALGLLFAYLAALKVLVLWRHVVEIPDPTPDVGIWCTDFLESRHRPGSLNHLTFPLPLPPRAVKVTRDSPSVPTQLLVLAQANLQPKKDTLPPATALGWSRPPGQEKRKFWQAQACSRRRSRTRSQSGAGPPRIASALFSTAQLYKLLSSLSVFFSGPVRS